MCVFMVISMLQYKMYFFTVGYCKSVWKPLKNIFCPFLYTLYIYSLVQSTSLFWMPIWELTFLLMTQHPKLSKKNSFMFITPHLILIWIKMKSVSMFISSTQKIKLTRKHHCLSILFVFCNNPLETWNWKVLP